jgi:LacI family transcriptional regulator
MKITLKDIASKVGVSTTTGCLVLNGKGERISKSVQDSIHKVAEEANYIPNYSAKSLTNHKSHTIGLLLPLISNIYFSELSQAVIVAARQNGYTVIFGVSKNDMQTDMNYIKSFISKGIDGLVYTASSINNLTYNDLVIEMIKNNNLPTVLLDRELKNSNIESVTCDNILGGEMVTEHLISQGHTRIGCVSGSHIQSSSAQRLEGFQKALKKNNIRFDEDLVFEGDYSMGSGEEAVPYLLGKKITAIFCFNDMMALGAAKILNTLGFKIPGDIALVGFDDVFFCNYLNTPITSVNQPVQLMGTTAVELLIQLINGIEPPKKRIVFKPSLKIRNSSLFSRTYAY